MRNNNNSWNLWKNKRASSISANNYSGDEASSFWVVVPAANEWDHVHHPAPNPTESPIKKNKKPKIFRKTWGENASESYGTAEGDYFLWAPSPGIQQVSASLIAHHI